MLKTKIVCTLGPATDDPDVLRALLQNGMNVARMNFSHGTHAEHKKRLEAFRGIRDELGLNVAVMLDTKGPEIRVCRFQNGSETLTPGQTFTLTSEEIEGTSEAVSITYKALYEDVEKGSAILIDDGLIELQVEQKSKKNIVCRVINGGVISNNKSINIPGAHIHLPYMSEKDRADVLFAVENGYDFISASFVRTAADVLEIKKILDEHGANHIDIIAKIENQEGVENIDDILKVCGGIMVARGDMGVEIPFENLPSLQKMLIKKCYSEGKKVITATQMLDSMMRNPRPTRAETTDIANAIYDGTSAIMLSGETAAGKYPVESLKAMVKIARKTESSINYRKRFDAGHFPLQSSVTNAISHATCTTAHDLGAAAIITVTKSGHTARMVSKFRPACPIIAATISETVCRQLALSWGVYPVMAEVKHSTDELFEHAVERSVEKGFVKNGDLTVITAGVPVGISGTTNILKVHLVGHVLATGTGVNDLMVSGNVCCAKRKEDILESFCDGDVLVTEFTSNDMLPILKRAGAIVVEEDGLNSHAAIVGMALEIPVIVGAVSATDILKSGTLITVDASRGIIHSGVITAEKNEKEA